VNILKPQTKENEPLIWEIVAIGFMILAYALIIGGTLALVALIFYGYWTLASVAVDPLHLDGLASIAVKVVAFILIWALVATLVRSARRK
jgi:hypothetical protein